MSPEGASGPQDEAGKEDDDVNGDEDTYCYYRVIPFNVGRGRNRGRGMQRFSTATHASQYRDEDEEHLNKSDIPPVPPTSIPSQKKTRCHSSLAVVRIMRSKMNDALLHCRLSIRTEPASMGFYHIEYVL